MNRLGWTILLLLLLVVTGLAFVLRVGGPGSPSASLPSDARLLPRPASPNAAGLVIPVAGVQAMALIDSWGDPRGGGTRVHHALDIPAPRGTPVLAAAPGMIEKLFESNDGGHTVYVRSPDGGTIYYYAHLDAYSADLREGASVVQGQQIATVGSTGDADPSAPHLHFEIKRMGVGEKWWQGIEVNPYPLLAGHA